VAGSPEYGNRHSGSIKFFGDSCVVEELEASQEGLSSMELLSRSVNNCIELYIRATRDRSQSGSQR
jgi:hypothetical protein